MMKYRQLGNTGLKLSIVGLGGSGFGNVYGDHHEELATGAVQHAFQRGVNYIDTAYWYGHGESETFLGKALANFPRDDFYISTKVGRYGPGTKIMFDFSAEKVMQSARESLDRLQLNYVDLLQIHDVEFAPSTDLIIEETLPTLKELQEKGLCRFIGITGYSLSTLYEIILHSKVKIDSVLSYCRLTLNDSSLVSWFDRFQEAGVPILNASPISMGLLSDSSVQKWHPASDDVKQVCKKAVEYCKEHGVDITKLAVNYSTSFDQATTTLVSMSDPGMVDKNINAAINSLTSKEKEVQQHILETFFGSLKQPHWEGVEVERYWKKMKNL